MKGRSLVTAVMAAVLSAGLQTATWRPLPVLAAVSGAWTQYHHDDAHTGNDASQTQVTAAAAGWVSPGLDAQVYASVLVYNGLVYAATLNNTVYALNQATGTVTWSNHLGAPVAGGWGCGNVSPQGILGTPVIDVAGGRIYVATLFLSDHLYHVIGLALATGAVQMNTAIPATIDGGFDWTIQQERGALSVHNGYVYVPFGGRAGDCGPYHGWVVGAPTNGSTSLVDYKTPGQASGLWAAGGVAIDDTTGMLFAATGNGTGGGCSSVNQNDAVVRLSAVLVLQDWFMPVDWQANWCQNDQDLGSAGPVLISPNLLFQAGKWGGGFLLNPNSLGHVNGQLFPAPSPYNQAEVCFGNHSDATFGSFAYAAPFIYLECEGQGIVALNTVTSTPSFTPCDVACPAPNWQAGGAVTYGPPIVAAGAVWAATNGGGLSAFDAQTGALIYQSAGFGINRFVTPSEAGGQVFVPSHQVIRSFNMTLVGSRDPASQSSAGTAATRSGVNQSGAGTPGPRLHDGGISTRTPSTTHSPAVALASNPLEVLKTVAGRTRGSPGPQIRRQRL